MLVDIENRHPCPIAKWRSIFTSTMMLVSINTWHVMLMRGLVLTTYRWPYYIRQVASGQSGMVGEKHWNSAADILASIPRSDRRLEVNPFFFYPFPLSECIDAS